MNCPNCKTAMRLSETGLAFVCIKCHTVIETKGTLRCKECYKEIQEGTTCADCISKWAERKLKKQRQTETFYGGSRRYS